MYNLPGTGEPCLPFHLSVDINKSTMMIYLFALMIYFDNFSVGAWVYLALHGSYGIFWATKSAVFPDPAFKRIATLSSCFLAPWPIGIIPYYFIGYWHMKGGEMNRNPLPERIFVALQLHVFGCVATMVTDAQKYLVLRERKGLITHGMNGWSRNLNYVGEMMIYASFGVLCQTWGVWYIYGYMWGIIFMLKMLIKEYSLSKKIGWKEYKAKTWFLLPKLYNSSMLSYFVYILFVSLSFYMYTHDGIEACAKKLVYN